MIATLRESKARLSEFVQLASRGEDVLITVRGTPSPSFLLMASNPHKTKGVIPKALQSR
jgi:antitoxin (DNA-binding transcriptional repressor) of toxin-antitoxin stability system